MIRSLKGRIAEAVTAGERVRGFPPDLISRAEEALAMIAAATRLDDLRYPPGNWLEALRGDRKGDDSIRINRQWRVCFKWTESGAQNVEIVDYHR